MAENFWWSRCGIFFRLSKKSIFVKNVHNAYARTIDSLNFKKDIKAFDAGCGAGSSTFPLAERGFDVLAVDFGKSILNQAIKLNEKKYHYNNIDFRFMDLSNPLPLQDNTFDLVTSQHAIMKIPNVDFTLKEFYRILKSGGTAVISTTPDSYTPMEWLMKYKKEHGWIKMLWDIRWLVLWNLPYALFTKKSERRGEHRWNEKEFSKHLENAGFKTLHIERVPYIHVGYIIGIFEKQK